MTAKLDPPPFAPGRPVSPGEMFPLAERKLSAPSLFDGIDKSMELLSASRQLIKLSWRLTPVEKERAVSDLKQLSSCALTLAADIEEGRSL